MRQYFKQKKIFEKQYLIVNVGDLTNYSIKFDQAQGLEPYYFQQFNKIFYQQMHVLKKNGKNLLQNLSYIIQISCLIQLRSLKSPIYFPILFFQNNNFVVKNQSRAYIYSLPLFRLIKRKKYNTRYYQIHLYPKAYIMIKDQLKGQNIQKIMRDASRIRNVCLISNRDSYSGYGLCKDLMQGLFKYELKQQQGQDTRFDSNGNCSNQQVYIPNQRDALAASFLYAGRQEKQSQHIFNVLSLHSKPQYNYNTLSTLALVDGAILVVSFPLLFESLDEMKSTLNLLGNESITPIIFIDISFLIQKQGKQISFADLARDIEHFIQKVLHFMQISAQRFSFKSSRRLNLNDFIIGNIQRNWAFSFAQTAELLIKINDFQTKQVEFQCCNFYYDRKQNAWDEKNFKHQDKQIIHSQIKHIESQSITIKTQNKTSQSKSFVASVCELIQIFYEATTNEKTFQQLIEFMNKIGEKIAENYTASKENHLIVQAFLQRKFQLSSKVFEAIISTVPSPLKNQLFKARSIFTKSQDDAIYRDIQKCSLQGELMIYGTKYVQYGTDPSNSDYVLGRVYSGTYIPGFKVQVQQCQGKSKMKKHYPSVKCLNLIGIKVRQFAQIIAGNLVLIKGINVANPVVALTSLGYTQDNSFRHIENLFQHTVKMAVFPKLPQQLPKLMQKLRSTLKMFPELQLEIAQTGEFFIKGRQPTSIFNYISQLEAQIEIIKSEIIPVYKETVTFQSQKIVGVKTPNKHNRLYGIAAPIGKNLQDGLAQLNDEEVTDQAYKCKRLEQDFGWDSLKDGSIWSFGQSKDNLLANCFEASSIQQKAYVNQIKQSVVSAFLWATKEGVLCQQIISNTKFSINDFQLINDANHRGESQIMPSSRRLFYGTQILNKPTLLQPINICNVLVEKDCVSYFQQDCKTYSVKYAQTPLLEAGYNYKYHKKCQAFAIEVPAFKWNAQILKNVQYAYDLKTQWKQVGGLAYDEGSRANQIVLTIRKRKGLPEVLPNIQNYIDLFDYI